MIEHDGLFQTALQVLASATLAICAVVLLRCFSTAGRSSETRGASSATRLLMLAVGLSTLPILFIFATKRDFRIQAHHGFMHSSYVYRILESGQFHPEDPLLAGELLNYPYLHHWLIATTIRDVAPITPGGAFALTNILALAITVVFTFRTAEILITNRRTCLLATVLALCGGPVVGGPILGALNAVGLPREVRMMPYLKFMVYGSNQLGFMFYMISMYAFLKLFCGKRVLLPSLTLVLGVSACGLFYAFSWIAFSLGVGLICAIAFATERRSLMRTRAAIVLTCIMIGTGISLPYIYSLYRTRSPGSGLELLPSAATFVRSIYIFVLAIGPGAALIYLARDRIKEWILEHSWPRIAVICVFSVPATMFLVLRAPADDQYKFLSHAFFPFAMVTAVALENLAKRQRLKWVVAAYVFLGVLGPIWQVVTVVRVYKALDPTVSEGSFLAYGEPNEAELYVWITKNTSVSAVFIDSHLTIPVFGRRSMFVADDRRKQKLLASNPEVKHIEDGWVMSYAGLNKIGGHSAAIVQLRLRIADQFLLENSQLPNELTVSMIHEQIGERPLYVVARSGAVRKRLKRIGLPVVFKGNRIQVYRVPNGFKTADAAGNR